MSLRVLVLTLDTGRPVREDASKLRGYIGGTFREHLVLHHHMEAGYLYTYPRVQYKVIEGTPVIVGIEEGVEPLKEISGQIEELRLGKSTYRVEGVQITQKRAPFGPCRRNVQYTFITPWLGLNAKNYEKFRAENEWKKKKELLNAILVGNVLSMCKSLSYVVDRKLYVHSLLDMHTAEYKGVPLIGFTGEFRLNFRIPDLLGLGKGVSQGFGTVRAKV
ncbi:CRISPR-associated endonuclease Cas6 [Methermicoccus shengliensis]|uniref:CRISPR-associated endonuclease Cas6 n=1 Tax=Methermicoccus shengliensis TaxID=660064 RepID=A0A832W041_9EURY|nr:CRISPR-associated endonuclease Cas6 [Methermicoccus shengliensis]MDI3488593.1 hypothetical protein [Methanosarcinales archaeon]MDN5294834.1 hypothetical protein [Methanosarcinales archaeon]HIH70054.1 CRISPR-associated endonuclease Cas6 [Methermicoccus shengliensis]